MGDLKGTGTVCPPHSSYIQKPLTIRVKTKIFLDVPHCRPDQVLVYGVARYETARISCEVVSNPSVGLRFHWVFNTSGETIQMENAAVKVRDHLLLLRCVKRN